MKSKKKYDVLYINYQSNLNLASLHGFTISDFINCSPIRVSDIVLVEPEVSFSDSINSLQKLSLEKLVNNLPEYYNFIGDICWVDLGQKTLLENVDPIDVAKLLYLSKMFTPISSPFFKSIGNSFAFLSHDNGWSTKIYSKQNDILLDILFKKVISSLNFVNSTIHSKTIDYAPIFAEICSQGMYIDFHMKEISVNYIVLPFYILNSIDDYDLLSKNNYLINSQSAGKFIYDIKQSSLNITQNI